MLYICYLCHHILWANVSMCINDIGGTVLLVGLYTQKRHNRTNFFLPELTKKKSSLACENHSSSNKGILYISRLEHGRFEVIIRNYYYSNTSIR